MGYMGFGMQNKVYKQKPRQPYYVSRKPSFIPLQNYSRRFKLQYSIKEKKSKCFYRFCYVGSNSMFYINIY